MVLAGLFVSRELSSKRPFLDPRLFGRNRPLLLVCRGFTVFNGVYYYFGYVWLPKLLQDAAGYDPGLVGVLMLPLAATSVVVTPLAGVGADGPDGLAVRFGWHSANQGL